MLKSELIKEYNSMEGRILHALPKGYKIRLELNGTDDHGHHIRVRGKNKDWLHPTGGKTDLSWIFIKAIRWAWKDLGERRVRTVYTIK